MVLDHLRKQRLTENGGYYKEQHLFALLEKSIDVVDKLAQELLIENEHKALVNNGIGREELAIMVKFMADFIILFLERFKYNYNFCRPQNNWEIMPYS